MPRTSGIRDLNSEVLADCGVPGSTLVDRGMWREREDRRGTSRLGVSFVSTAEEVRVSVLGSLYRSERLGTRYKNVRKAP